MKKAKLVVTLRYCKELAEILDICRMENVNCFRINLGRSNIENNAKLFEILNHKVNSSIIFLDLPGEKQRICKLDKESFYPKGRTFSLCEIKGKGDIPIENYSKIIDLTSIGDIFIFGDNDLMAKVIQINENIVLNPLNGEKIKSHSGFHNISHPTINYDLSEKEKKMITMFDKKNVIWGISFADTVQRVCKSKKNIKNGKVFAKIETKQAVKNMHRIIKYVDAVMLARGDLSVYYDDKIINTEILQEMIKIVVQNNKKLALATGYFSNIAKGEKMSWESLSQLQIACKNADYLISNETSYSKFWKDIIQFYQNFNYD